MYLVMRFNCKLLQKNGQVIRTLFSPQFNNMSKHTFPRGHSGTVLNNTVICLCSVHDAELPGFAVQSSSQF